eukprot:3828862-Pyramimonas_sp.AAC.1
MCDPLFAGHGDALDAVELGPPPPSDAGGEGADVEVDDHGVGALVGEDVVYPGRVLGGAITFPVGIAPVGHGAAVVAP